MPSGSLDGLRDDPQDTRRRVLLHARFDTPGAELHVFNAHFSWVAEQALDNVTESLPHLGWVEGPAALVGDFNQTPDTEALSRLREAGWVDAWRELHPNEDGFTLVEGGAPCKRIDYVLLNAQLVPRLRAAHVMGSEGDRERISDHAGVLVTLSG